MRVTMKKILAAGALLAGVLGLTSCDYIGENDRYIELPVVEEKRAVLLEDFTGQMCTNCPEGHEIIEQLEQQYGKDYMIAVSIHCGDFGLSVNRTSFEHSRIGLMTEEGNSICAAYGIDRWPMGVVNMGSPINMDQWATAVRQAIESTTDVHVEAEALVENVEGKDMIKISSTTESGSTYVNTKIQYWIVEDGIVAQQKDGSTTIPDYTHNNVFRAQVFPGIKGEDIALTPGVETTTTGEIELRYTDKERWAKENLRVVVIVSDNNGVLQVKSIDIE